MDIVLAKTEAGNVVKLKDILNAASPEENKLQKTTVLPLFLREFLEHCEYNLRCPNINGAMHTLLVGECLTGAKSVR